MKKCLFFIAIIAFLSCLLIRAGAQTNQHIKSGDATTAVNFPAGGCVYTWTNSTPGIGLAASGSGNIPSFTGTNTGTSALTATITGTPASSDFAYIANSGSNNVSVISTLSNTVIATIPVGTTPFGVSVNPNSTLVYITNQGSNNVSVINTLTNMVTATITVGQTPTGVVVSPDGSRVYVTNAGDNTVSIIDASTNAQTGIINVGASPYGIAITPDGNKLYVANYNSNTISAINISAGNAVTVIPAQSYPFGIAISPDGTRAYVSNSGIYTITAINTADNSVVENLSAFTNPTGLVVGADDNTIYFVTADGYLCTYNILTNFRTSVRATGRAYSLAVAANGYAYIVDNINGFVEYSDFNGGSGGAITVGSQPYSLGNFIAKGPSCGAQPVTFTITVDPPPIINISAISGVIFACAGSPSSGTDVQQFAVSGSGLSADITATAPAGFEISTSAGGSYSNTLILKQTAGLVSNTPIYVRSAATAAAGPIKGDVVLHTTGLANKNIPVAGNVAQLPTVNEVANQSVFNGNATTSVTFTGTGNTFSWVNSTPGIGLPASGTGNIPLFTAVNNTANPVKATVTVTPLPAPAYGYVANINANNVSVINLATNATVATIPVGIQPTGVAVSPDGKRVYVTNQSLIGPVNPSTVSVIDVASNTVITNITVGYRPFGIAISADGSRLYVTNQSPSNSVSIINTANNTVIQTIPTIGENPQSVAVSPDGTRLYVTNNSNSYISVINTATTAVLTWIQGGAGPMGIAVSPDNSRIYVANSSSNTVSVIDAVTNQVLYEIPVENQPTGLTISPAGDRTYVSNSLSGTVSVIDNNEHRVIATITAGMVPRGVSLNADGTKLYVSNQASNNVSVINTLDNSVLTSINAGDGAYSFGSFVTPATTCTGKPVTFTITVNPTANITGTVPLQPLNTTYGTPSASTSFTVSGTNLSAGILVTPPAGFELSTDNITFTSTVTVGATGTLNAAPVYIRLKSTTNAGGYAGNIVLSSAGAPATNVQMPNSMVTPAPLTIQANNASKVYGAILNSNITSAAFTVLGNGLKNGNTITTINLFFDGGTAAADHVGIYETIMPTVTTGANGFLPDNYTITYIPGALSITPAPLTIAATDVSKPYGTALTGVIGSAAFTSTGLQNQESIGSVAVAYGTGSGVNDALGFYPGTITPSVAGGGTFDPGNYLITYKTGSITVTPPTGIMVSGTLNALNTIYGTPSVSASFNVSGTGLSGGILITPPSGFEVSTNNSTFGTSVIIGQAGDVAAITVYIRLAAITPAGTYSGNISLSSGTATANEVMPASTVIATPLTIIANNKTKVAGTANPALTVIYTGFVNNESAAQLVIKPLISTTANTLSAAGEYPITASGAASPNYIISYVDGVLTINPLPPSVNIPNAFTPNGDGTNDVWVIASLAYYPNNTVSIYNRYGQQLYHSAGYAKPWDGTYNGTRVPEAVYYYIIQLDKNQPALSGHVTVIR